MSTHSAADPASSVAKGGDRPKQAVETANAGPAAVRPASSGQSDDDLVLLLEGGSRYLGLSWSAPSSRKDLLSAASPFTGLRYTLPIDSGVRGGSFPVLFGPSTKIPFSGSLRLPHALLTALSSADDALLAAELHDFSQIVTIADEAGVALRFLGSQRARDAVTTLLGPASDADAGITPDAAMALFRRLLAPIGTAGENSADETGGTQDFIASYFTSVKSALKQNADGSLSVTFRVDPAEMPMWLTNAPMGHLVHFAATDGGPSDFTTEFEQRATAAKRSLALLPGDPDFQRWIRRYDHWGLVRSSLDQGSLSIAEAVEETVKRLCGVPSKSDLSINRDGLERCEQLIREFYTDMRLQSQGRPD